MTDTDIREEIKSIEARDDVNMDSYEAGFVEDVVYSDRPMTDKQRAYAIEMIEKYG